jgi:small subunit ribosomal protein S2
VLRAKGAFSLFMQSETNTTSLIEKLFKAGAHFGFTKSRRHPTVAPYIFGSKQGTDIIDLEKTSALLAKAKEVVKETAKAGKVVLFVGTKEEIVTVVRDSATKIEMPFVVNRWIGGMLTNFAEIRKRIYRLNDLLGQGVSGELERKYTKKERVIIGREIEKLNFNFAGIKDMERLPGLLVIVDPRHDSIAAKEARVLNIPVIGIVSSDTNLKEVDYPIVANDTLQTSVRTLLEELGNAYAEGKSEFVPASQREEVKARA